MKKQDIKIGSLYWFNYYYFLLFPTAKAADFAISRNWAPFRMSANEVVPIKRFWLLWYDDEAQGPNKELMEMCEIFGKVYNLGHVTPGEMFSIVEIVDSDLGGNNFTAKILAADGSMGWTVFNPDLDSDNLFSTEK